jgi:PiT family inorganic phosphate transporter
VSWGAIGGKVVIPLLVSPLLALALVAVVLSAQWVITDRFKSSPECLCAIVEPVALPTGLVVTGSGLAFSQAAQLRMSVGSEESCAKERPAAFRLTSTQLHWLTSGATSLARGLNDAPKIVALIIVAGSFFTEAPATRLLLFAVVTLGMVAGSFVAGRRVTTLLAEKVTPMNHQEGFLANLVTAALVAPGAALGLPMSTTQVSSGAIIGLGFRKKAGTNWRTVQSMVLAWVVTVPLAAALGIVFYVLLDLHYAG